MAACTLVGLLAIAGCAGSTPSESESGTAVASELIAGPASAIGPDEWCQNDKDPSAAQKPQGPMAVPDEHYRAPAHLKEGLRAQNVETMQAAVVPRPVDPKLLERQSQYLKELELLRAQRPGQDPVAFEAERIALKRRILGYPAVPAPR